MPDAPDRLAEAIRRVLKEEMARSPAVSSLLVELAELVLAEARRLAGDADGTPGSRSHAEEGVGIEGRTPSEVEAGAGNAGQKEATAPIRDEPVVGSVPLTLGGLAVEVEVRGTRADLEILRRTAAGPSEDREPEALRPRPIDLGLIERRARLKAESCRFFIERRRDRGDPAMEPGLRARIDAMIASAKRMPECFLWVLWPHEEQPTDDRLMQIAACYDALADASALCARATASDGRLSDGEVRQAFQLLAEASSALRVALEDSWLTSDDTDQEETHLWLRRETVERGVFVERHMKLDDPASPEHAAEIAAEAVRLMAAEDARLKKARNVGQLINKVVYHARRIRNDPHPSQHDFKSINRAMEELRTAGVGPTDPRVATLRKRFDAIEFPTDVPRHAHLAFEPRTTSSPDNGQDDRWSQRVAALRDLLHGGRIVVVGGEPRQDAISRLGDAFGATIEWVELPEHGSGARMQAPIERADTRVVLVLIKLTGHLHANEAREYSRAAGVPCVNIEAGYNPNMVAEQVMLQAGARLRAAESS